MTGQAGFVWFDVTSLLPQLRDPCARPSGIRRSIIEVLRVARVDGDLGPRIRLVVFNERLPGFAEMAWREIESVFAPSPALAPKPAAAGPLDRLLGRLKHRIGRAFGGPSSGVPASDPAEWRHPFAAGDLYVNLGGWWDSQAVEVIATLQDRHGLPAGLFLVYDCIPLIYPEYANPATARQMRARLPALRRAASGLMSISDSATRDMGEAMFPAPARVAIHRIRLGDAQVAPRLDDDGLRDALHRLGLGGRPFVAMVGTIENRKNHALAFRTWRELLRRHGNVVPDLVIAGAWGLKTADLRRQLADCDHLDGRVKVIESPTDAELAAVYQGARLTLFPSLYEGWGLPVAESHAYGKVCVASSSSSVPEAGGGLAVLFENDCRTSLIEAIEPLLLDDGALDMAERKIRAGFEPWPWSRTWSDGVKAAIIATRKNASAGGLKGGMPADPAIGRQ